MNSTEKPVARKGKRKKWRWILGVSFLLLSGLAAAVALRPKDTTVEITTEKAAVRDLVQVVSATGKIQPNVEVKISPEAAGEIIALPVEEGDAVKKGDLLIKIKPDTYQAQVEQEGAALNSAQASSLQSKAEMIQAEDELRRALELKEKSAIAASDLASAQAKRDATAAAYDASLFRIKQAEGSLSQAREQLSKTIIYAPMDGTISALNAELGERVVATGQFAGTEVMRVADLSDMEVRVEINENDVVNVKLKDKVKITVDSYPGQIFQGEVRHIASSASVKGENTQEEVTNFLVKIAVVAPASPLRPGMSATADIETATAANVLSVPIQSVTVRSADEAKSMAEIEEQREKEKKDRGGLQEVRKTTGREKLDRVVFLKQGDKAVLRKVETGIADSTHIEIKSGLTPGDEVISGSYAAISKDLKDQSPIKLEVKKEKK